MRDKCKQIAFYILLLLIVVIIMLPVITMFLTSIKTSNEIFVGAHFWPEEITADNYIKAIHFQNGLFGTGILNSVILCLSVVFAQIIVASMAGYALARFDNAFFRSYSSLLLVLYMLPISLALIPLFTIFKTMNIIDTRVSIFLAYMMMSLPFAIWMFKGFVASIPAELEEAAMIEGCSRAGAFVRVILPLTSPGIASISIYTFLNCWSEYLMSSVFVKQERLRTVTVMLQFFRQEQFSDWGSLLAAACMSSVPAVLLLLFAQKYIVAGISAGAVKG